MYISKINKMKLEEIIADNEEEELDIDDNSIDGDKLMIYGADLSDDQFEQTFDPRSN
jgi:hypothetical protein